MKTWSPLVHKTHLTLKELGVSQGSVLLAVSGGRDSMTLLWVMRQLQGALRLNLQVVHVHHGDGVSDHRDQAQKFVSEFCEKEGLPFWGYKSPQGLLSEAACRKFRREALMSRQKELVQAGEPVWILTAHHQQDLLETRVLRLLRGTGVQGLSAILPRKDPWVRPWLDVTPNEIQAEKCPFILDPSNKSSGYLRNWLRNHWLKALERRRPGAVESLGRSLKNLAELQDKTLDPVWVTPTSFKRGLFHTLTSGQKRQLLATCLHRVVGSDYSLGQIREIQKQLDNSQKEHTFRMKNSLWKVNAEHVSVRKAP